jgi:hypothetical protein
LLRNPEKAIDAATGDDQQEGLPRIRVTGFSIVEWFLASMDLFMQNPITHT